MTRRAAARDENEPAIVETLEASGWVVWRLDGPGIPDLLCLRRGKIALVEVKNPEAPNARLTPAQQERFGEALRSGVAVHVVETVEDVLRVRGSRTR